MSFLCVQKWKRQTDRLRVPSMYTAWAVNMDVINKSVLLAASQK